MIKLRETIWILLLLSYPGYGATPSNKQIDNINNSSGGSLLSVPSSGASLITDTNSVTLSNKTISGSSNTITNVSLTSGVTGTLGIGNGGTGIATTPSSGNILIGNGSAYALQSVSNDATLASTGALTLATVNSNTGSFGSASSVPSFTVNGKGLITAASSTTVVAPAGTLTGTTLASNVVSSSLTTVGTIGTGTWQGTLIATTFGGTGVNSSATFPTSGTILTDSNSVSISNKTISGSNNTLSQLPVASQIIQDVFYGNSSTTTFTLSFSQVAATGLVCSQDGGTLVQGSSNDYTVSGTTLTMNSAPATGQRILCIYSRY